MSFALSAGVTGLQAHQKMLDIAGNNLANINTTAFKSSRIIFAELLSETIKRASRPTSGIGGTNPQQMGSGVGVAGISPNMSQGNLIDTGNPLDLAIDGEGYFVLSDGQQSIYTRAGAFAVDADNNLVDPGTGYLVQRIGSVGVSEGFQTAGDSNIHVPYDVAMAANATSEIKIVGNLDADITGEPQTNVLSSDVMYTTNNGGTATGSTLLDDLDQSTSGTYVSATLTVGGYDHDGNDLVDSTPLVVTAATDMDDVIDHINTVLGSSGTASLAYGKITITDTVSGYSKSDMKMVFANSGTADFQEPAYFEIPTVGGEEVKSVDIAIFDTQGGKHFLSGAFVRTNTANIWDMVLTSITGNIYEITMDDRRIEGVTFDASDSSYTGLTGLDSAEFAITFAHDILNPQTVAVNMGAAGRLDGLTQFAGISTAVAQKQDGYEAGRLTTVSINEEGTVIGVFSNGIKKNIATLQIALFQNPAALESMGGGYFNFSANSGEAVATQALTGGAGSIHGGALEKSNVDVATEFINMIQAQNGFQANARTIKVANEILRELTDLIR